VRREQTLRRKLKSLDVLGEVVNAMKSLSAHHVRTARAGLAAARAYRDGIDQAIASVGIAQAARQKGSPAVLLIAADLGLCNGYNSRLVETAVEQYQKLEATSLYCIGRRPLTALRRASVPVTRSYGTVTSVAGLTSLLLTLADDVLGDYLTGTFSSLHIVSARFDGVGAFTPHATRVLPMASTRTVTHTTAAPYASAAHLAQTAVREYLYSTLFELLLDALAAEHGMRLVATQSAGEWLDERLENIRRQLASARRESSTQEVLDLVSGVRQRRRHEHYA
jgi:F-type H+-transporting ATPase subunit gamma